MVIEEKEGLTAEQVASEHELEISHVQEAQAFYRAHKNEIDANIQTEKELSDRS